MGRSPEASKAGLIVNCCISTAPPRVHQHICEIPVQEQQIHLQSAMVPSGNETKDGVGTVESVSVFHLISILLLFRNVIT